MTSPEGPPEAPGTAAPRSIPEPTGRYRGRPPSPEGLPPDLLGHYPPIHEPGLPEGTRGVVITRDMSPAVNALFQRVFGEERSLERYEWKFWGNPASAPIGFAVVEEESGRVLGASPTVSKRVWVNGSEARALQLCETAVDPDARGGGALYRAITLGVSRGGSLDGVLFAYGGRTTRETITLGQRHFNYRTFFDLHTYERRLNLRHALGKRLGNLGHGLAGVTRAFTKPKADRAEDAFSLELRTTFGPEFDEAWERLRDRYELVFFRDAASLHWRFAACPNTTHRTWVAIEDGQLQGHLVYRDWVRDGVRIATVLDLFDGAREDVAAALLSRASRDAAEHGCDFFHYAPLPGRPSDAAVQSLPGFELSEREAVDLVIGAPLQIRVDEAAAYEQQRTFLNAESWHYTQGDSDFFD